MSLPQQLEFAGGLVARLERLAELDEVCVGLVLHLQLEGLHHGRWLAGGSSRRLVATFHCPSSKERRSAAESTASPREGTDRVLAQLRVLTSQLLAELRRLVSVLALEVVLDVDLFDVLLVEELVKELFLFADILWEKLDVIDFLTDGGIINIAKINKQR